MEPKKQSLENVVETEIKQKWKIQKDRDGYVLGVAFTNTGEESFRFPADLAFIN